MKTITFAFAGLVLFSTWAHAGETLSADAVKKLISGKTAHALSPTGNTPKVYFAPDGKLYRYIDSKLSEGTWRVEDDGTHCVSIAGGCAKVVSNGDGTYDRITEKGVVIARWLSIVDGKDF